MSYTSIFIFLGVLNSNLPLFLRSDPSGGQNGGNTKCLIAVSDTSISIFFRVLNSNLTLFLKSAPFGGKKGPKGGKIQSV